MLPPFAAASPIFTILLVEDEPAVREVTREVLEAAGHRVLEAAGPEEALLLSSRFKGHIHLLLTDVVMPSMNGHELATRLTSSRPELIKVYMSGYANDAGLRQSLGQAPEWYIQKPFTVSLLLARISEALAVPALSGQAMTSPSVMM